MNSIRTEAEILHQLNEAADSAFGKPSKYPGMSFEDGVVSALEWLTDEQAVAPMEDNGGES